MTGRRVSLHSIWCECVSRSSTRLRCSFVAIAATNVAEHFVRRATNSLMKTIMHPCRDRPLFVLAGSASAQAAPAEFRGSDTLYGVISQAINQLGLDGDLVYTGGGSGLGETGLRAGAQGIAPMSRALSAAGRDDLQKQGVTPVELVIGLDGVAVFVKRSEASRRSTSTLRGIFTCEIVDWSAVPGRARPDPSRHRRNDVSGTTTRSSRCRRHTFGARQAPRHHGRPGDRHLDRANAIALGLSAERPGTRRWAVVPESGGAAIAPGSRASALLVHAVASPYGTPSRARVSRR